MCQSNFKHDRTFGCILPHASKYLAIINNLRISAIQSEEIIFILHKWQRKSLSSTMTSYNDL